MEIQHKLYRLLRAAAILAGVSLTAPSCTEEALEGPEAPASVSDGTQLVISLAVPVETEADSPDSRSGESTPTATEKRINDLRFIAFGSDGGASVVNRTLLAPADLPVYPSKGIATYEIKNLSPGQYRVYIIANMGTALESIATENELKSVILDYSSKLPEAGNLPMIYEPLGSIKVGSVQDQASALEATMKIAAVKVRYNIVFDSSVNSDVFGGAGLKIKGATIRNTARQAYAVQNTAKTDIAVRDVKAAGLYYTSFSDTPSNASTDNRDVIETGTAQGAQTMSAYSGKWVWQGTAYLPERYVAKGGAATILEIEAAVTPAGSSEEGNVRNRYTINLAQYDGGPADELSMPRGTYYEVIGRVKSLGEAELDASVSTKEWTSADIATDFMHTFLTLSKTTAKVGSLESETITYDTDGSGGAAFVCDSKLLGHPIVNASISSASKSITFSVNPDIDITKLTDEQTVGTATCYITAGNIRKQVLVDYNITPYFTITKAVKIQYRAGNAAELTKEFEYETNLGGVMLTVQDSKTNILLGQNGQQTLGSFTRTLGNSTIEVKCATPGDAKGVITVTAKTDPVTTTIFYLDAYPQAARTLQKFDSFMQGLEITVMPDLGKYRINFRALNDWHTFNGGETNISGEWLEGKNPMDNSAYPTEDRGAGQGQSNNWIDYWYCANRNEWESAWDNGASNDRYPHQASHKIYIWTQIGETTSSSSSNEIWRFTEQYKKGTDMTEDYNNRGWYRYDLDPNTVGLVVDNNTVKQPQKTPEPGTTLMIFNNHTNAGLGYTVHRATHHLDPGIPLFDFEDREGWVVYDPTADPYYRIYDDKPYVEDVVYTIWSDVKPTGWYRKYGVAENTASITGANVRQFTVYSNNVQSATQQNGYWRYQIRMKAVRGDYEKAIRVKFTGVTDNGSTTVTPGVGNYVYYFYKTGNSNGWRDPRAYFYTDNSNTGWGSASFVNPISSTSADSGIYYKFAVPAGYENGRVIFVNNDGSRQYPAANQPGLVIENRNKAYYADTNAWQQYGDQPQGSVTTTSGEDGFVMFNGRAYPGNEGYFNSKTKTWTAGKPF